MTTPDWEKLSAPTPEAQRQFADEQARENAADLARGLMEIFRMEMDLLKIKLKRDTDHD